MELPIAPQTYQTPPQALLRAIRQADLLLAEASTEPLEIEGATLFVNPKLPGVHMANFATQLHCPERHNPLEVIQSILQYFAQKAQRCYWLQLAELAWSEPWREAAESLGYKPGPPIAVLRLHQWLPPAHREHDLTAKLQILPGRALRGPLYQVYQQIAREEHHASTHLAQQLADWHIAHLDEPRCESLVARHEGRIVGYVNVVSVGNVGVIDHVFTLQAYRHRGVASCLLEHALNFCARAQHDSVVLEALSGGDAMLMYQRRGFVVIGEHTRYENLNPSPQNLT